MQVRSYASWSNDRQNDNPLWYRFYVRDIQRRFERGSKEMLESRVKRRQPRDGTKIPEVSEENQRDFDQDESVYRKL